MNETLKLMHEDPLAIAEQLTGKSYKTDDGTAGLGMTLQLVKSDMLHKALAADADTDSYNQTYTEFRAVVTGLGFEPIYLQKFAGRSVEETYEVFWRAGILLHMESYGGDRGVNTADIRFNLRVDPEKGTHDLRYSGGVCRVDYDILVAHMDVRQGLKATLEHIVHCGKVLEDWVERPWMWLNTYRDNEFRADHKEVVRKKVLEFPEHVRLAITPTPARLARAALQKLPILDALREADTPKIPAVETTETVQRFWDVAGTYAEKVLRDLVLTLAQVEGPFTQEITELAQTAEEVVKLTDAQRRVGQWPQQPDTERYFYAADAISHILRESKEAQ